MRCLFCVMFDQQLPPGNHPFMPEDVCEAHRSVTGIPEYLAAHPNGEHTDSCGCGTLEDLKRDAEIPTINLTYLARGILPPDPFASPEQPRAVDDDAAPRIAEMTHEITHTDDLEGMLPDEILSALAARDAEIETWRGRAETALALQDIFETWSRRWKEAATGYRREINRLMAMHAEFSRFVQEAKDQRKRAEAAEGREQRLREAGEPMTRAFWRLMGVMQTGDHDAAMNALLDADEPFQRWREAFYAAPSATRAATEGEGQE